MSKYEPLIGVIFLLILASMVVQAAPLKEPAELKNAPVKIGDIIGNASTYQDKMVVIQGKIDSECSSGCWFNVTDATGRIYVDNKPSNFVIPQKKGSNVKVYGQVYPNDGDPYVVSKMVEINGKIYKFSKSILVSPSDITDSDVILDVSSNPQKYISGAVHIDYRDFSDGGNMPKSSSELSEILGNAGISRDNSVVIYGKDPSDETYVYWIMKYLGHEKIKVLDGGIDGWVAAGLPTIDSPKIRAKTKYIPAPRSDLTATYDYVRKAGVQVVDTRTPNEFKIGALPGSKNIPYDDILDNGKIKSEATLKALFAGLTKSKPIAVYANNGIKATAVWYTLELLGYSAKLYAGDEWVSILNNQNSNLFKTPKPSPASPSSGGSARSSSVAAAAPSGHSCH